MLTRNNRLLEQREYSDPNKTHLLRTVRYQYIQETGDVAHITLKDQWTGNPSQEPAAYKKYYDLWLIYAPNGTLWRTTWQEWDNIPNSPWHAGWIHPGESGHPDRMTSC